jgi:TPR repeat protein
MLRNLLSVAWLAVVPVLVHAQTRDTRDTSPLVVHLDPSVRATRLSARFEPEFAAGVDDFRTERYRSALREFAPHARHGDAWSQYYLGLIYHGGLEVARDDHVAAGWFRQAAGQGLAKAEYQLGRMYQHGWGLQRNRDQAEQWYFKAARQGLPEAQFNLGLMIQAEPGSGFSVREQAAYWLRKAAASGNPLYQMKLADLYYAANELASAARWMRGPARQGVAHAQWLLGFLYESGDGVHRDYPQALQWLRRADAQGNTDAADWLSIMYRAGKGVPADLSAAANWKCRAAGWGHGATAFNAIMQLEDFGPVGRACLRKLAAAGNAIAQLRLGSTLVHQHDLAEGIRWLRKSAEQANPAALEKLADMYAVGIGVPRDPVIAVTLFELSGQPIGDGPHSVYQPSARLIPDLSNAQREEVQRLVSAWKVGQPLPQHRHAGGDAPRQGGKP